MALAESQQKTQAKPPYLNEVTKSMFIFFDIQIIGPPGPPGPHGPPGPMVSLSSLQNVVIYL